MYYIKSTKFSTRKRTTKKGEVYDVVFRVVDERGVQHQKTLCGYETPKLAAKAYRQFVTTQCTEQPANLEVAKKRVLFDDAYRDYITYLTASTKESSLVTVEGALRNFVLPAFAGRALDSITEGDLYRWQDGMLARRKSNGQLYARGYVLRIQKRFKTFFAWAALRYNARNPFARVTMPRTVQKAVTGAKIEFWDKDEFARFIDVVDDDTLRAFYTLLFYTGIRKGEAFALTAADYDGKSLRINKTVTTKTTDGSAWKVTTNKTDTDHTIPLALPARLALDEYIAKVKPSGAFLFGGERPLPAETVRRKFTQYARRADVKPIKIHGLRHSFVSMCIHVGGNYTVIASLIGDTPEQVLKTYGHMWASDRDAIIKLLN